MQNETIENDILKLENQVCFPFYAISRMITRMYQPYLDELGITYPQYLVLMVLWDTDNVPISNIAEKLLLNTNTLTPLLKRMESQGMITRVRSAKDQRQVHISLTNYGKKIKEQAKPIPLEMVNKVNYPLEDIKTLKNGIDAFLEALRENDRNENEK